jgi:hypothetical protein
LRTLLKYRDRDIIKDLLKIGTSTGVPKDILDEFNFLLEKINIEQIILVRESYFQFISLELVDKFINLFRKSPRDGWRLYKFRTQIRRELKPFQRKSRRNIWFDYHRASFRKNRVVRYFVNLFNKSLKTKKKMNKLNLVFAFIGPDGSGKTTIVRSVREWLSWRLEVQSYYMGSSEPSIRTMILKRLFKIFRFWVVVWGHFFGSKSIFKRLFNIPSQLFNCLRFISEAFRQYQPIMDGSQISYRYQGKHWFLTRILSEIEERIYQGISPANHIFILHVSPNLSKIRKPDHKLDMIELKKLAIEQISDDRLNLIDIDSSIPLEDMLLQVKSKIWDFL